MIRQPGEQRAFLWVGRKVADQCTFSRVLALDISLDAR
jgi:hypothetical protein